MLRTKETIHNDINRHFFNKSGIEVEKKTVMDLYTASVSDALEEAHIQIEENKNPHIYTKLKGQELDDTGIFVNCPREQGESDASYLYRLMNWTFVNQASNTTAIKNELLNLEYGTAEYIPFTRGSGTATVYIIPKSYDSQESIDTAVSEVKDKVKAITSPSLYIEYVIPEISEVVLHLCAKTKTGDIEIIKNNIKSQVAEYVNGIAPKDYLEVGVINMIGVNEPGVSFFNTLRLMVDGKPAGIKVLQEISKKFILQDIIWHQH